MVQVYRWFIPFGKEIHYYGTEHKEEIYESRKKLGRLLRNFEKKKALPKHNLRSVSAFPIKRYPNGKPGKVCLMHPS